MIRMVIVIIFMEKLCTNPGTCVWCVSVGLGCSSTGQVLGEAVSALTGCVVNRAVNEPSQKSQEMGNFKTLC